MANQFYWIAPDPNLPWDNVRIYVSTDYNPLTGSGTWTLQSTVSTKITVWVDETGAPTNWYKIAFYDAVHSVQGNLSTPFQPNQVPALSLRELRNYLALDDKDPPNNTILLELLNNAATVLNIDTAGGLPADVNRLALKFLSASYVADWIARRLLHGGAIEFSIDGVSIKKPTGIWQSEANEKLKQYDALLLRYRVDSMWTYPLANNGFPAFGSDVSDILHGLDNAYLSPPIPSLGIGVNDGNGIGVGT